MKFEISPPLMLEWSDFLSSGNSDVDKEHKCVVEFINDLYQARFDHDQLRIKLILEHLKTHAIHHCKHEEDLMRAVNYPDLEAHVKEHEYVAQSIDRYLKTIESNSDAGPEIQEFLFWWLIHHIRNFDIKAQKYIQEHS